MKRVTSAVIVASIVLWAAVARPQSPARDYVGYVVRVAGGWTMQQDAQAAPIKVVQWQELREGSRLVPTDAKGQVSVLLVDGRTVVLDAAKPETWKQPVHLVSASETGSNKWIRLAMRWLSEKPQVVVPAMARGAKEVTPLRDQVVRWSAAGIDPNALLGAAAQEPLILRFEALDNEGKTAPGDPLMLDWDPANGRKPPIVLEQSLYRVVAFDPDGVKPGRDMWILAVEPARFAQSARSFEELTRAAAPWATSDARSARGFLRAALLALANDTSGS
jgi:hypothetical protein